MINPILYSIYYLNHLMKMSLLELVPRTIYNSQIKIVKVCLSMSLESKKSRKIIGIVSSVVLFVVWLIVDIYTFPLIMDTMGYPVFEIVAYGSWFIVLLVILGIFSVTGAIPGRSKELEIDSS